MGQFRKTLTREKNKSRLADDFTSVDHRIFNPELPEYKQPYWH
jgi:hypothetical protein